MSDPVSIQKTGFLEESPGVHSSKRLWGTILLSLGAVIMAGVAYASLFMGNNDTGGAAAAGTSLMIAGGGLLGIGVLEGVRK